MNTIARWHLYLDAECPHCEQEINLLDYDDFWDGRALDLAEHGTERSRNVRVVCPSCGEPFLADLTY